jgi:uncharacterized membrane protein
VATPASRRQVFLDGLRGLALIFMVLNHTGRWWIERPMGWPRYHLVYLTVTLAAPIFLFLVGFCLPLSYLNSTVTRGERYASVAWKYIRRGLKLVVAGWFLNLLVFPDEPLFGGGVLQTIGLTIIGLTLLLPLLPLRAGRWALLAAALGIYASFAVAHPFLRRWLTDHPVIADVWFYDFPLWPWFAVALLGLVLGWVWAEGQRRGGDERRYFAVMSAAGLVCLAAFLSLELAVGTTPHFFSGRDLVLNRHWNPGAVTCLWILGIIFSLLPAVYDVMKVRRVPAPWLVVLGQNALMLYFVHQVIVLTFLRQRFGVLFHSWWPYVLANALLLAALVVIAEVWPEFKRRALALVRSSTRRGTSSIERPGEAL